MTATHMRGRFRRAVLACGVLALAARHAAAQGTGVIGGRVTDRTGAPVAGAMMSIAELSRATSTDSSGRYRFTDVPSGTFTVAARRIGYVPAASRVTIGAFVSTLDMVLSPGAQRIEP